MLGWRQPRVVHSDKLPDQDEVGYSRLFSTADGQALLLRLGECVSIGPIPDPGQHEYSDHYPTNVKPPPRSLTLVQPSREQTHQNSAEEFVNETALGGEGQLSGRRKVQHA